MTATAKPQTIDEYISAFPAETQVVLRRMRDLIRKCVPSAEEGISYGIPTFSENGSYIVYFAGHKKHVSLYPAPREHESFKDELMPYKGGKGTMQIPLDQPLPTDLIERIVRFCIDENRKKINKSQRKSR